MTVLTQARLKELVVYNSTTGIFTRRVTTAPRAMKGMQCGDLDGKGYLRMRVNGKRYSAHRLAWLYVTGRWPENEVDHKNCIKTDNRWCNLRAATPCENKRNTRPYSNNKSGYKGVSWHTCSQKWRARILLDGKEKSLGLFMTPEAANAAYSEAAEKHFGAFARAS